jgi:hypothetical protein
MLWSNLRVVELGALKKDVELSITDLNKELKSIRTNREQTGCNCKPIKLDKLSVVKIKQELVAVGVPGKELESLGKSELTSKLKDILTTCRLCIDNRCSCVANDLPCSAESCSCLKGGNRSEQQQPCANPNGHHVFDPELVHQYRSQYIAPIDLASAVLSREKIKRRGSV